VLLAKTPHTIPPDELHATASRAHGYVGADLAAVVREAGTLAIKRFLSSASPLSTQSAQLTAADLAAALPTVRPSTLREHAIAAPPVRFADIGGLASTIARLRESVEWPLVHREKLARLGVRAPKGVLLCGPPGCSKTILVRAIATESGVNFVAVRGPEVSIFDPLFLFLCFLGRSSKVDAVGYGFGYLVYELLTDFSHSC
jgi:AAA family ATPase